MRVGWLSDPPRYVGGAELTQAEFRAATPEGVEVIDCPPGGVVSGLDRYVIHNFTAYTPEDLAATSAPRFRYHHDMRRQGEVETTDIFCSRAQRERKGGEGPLIPPPVDLAAYRPPKKTDRTGTCSIASWQNHGKGAHLIDDYQAANGPVTVYGDGPFRPQAADYRGPLKPEDVAETLWRYERFVFLPTAFEPFGRCVAEAHTAGCELVVNRNAGALEWLQTPEAMETARADFWEVVCG